MIKKLGYYLFASFFCLFRLAPVKKQKIFMVATHDDSDEGNIGIVAKRIKEKMPDTKIVLKTKRDGIRRPFSFFMIKAYHMATAGTIFLDNEFMPMAFTPISAKVKVVQLWHGTGTIKKFGQDSDTGEVAELARRANERLTHLIVNSEKTKRQYASAFNQPLENVHILGLPRTDLILDEKKMSTLRQEFWRRYPQLENRRCILYAPTFRDSEVEHPRIALDLASFVGQMAENEVLLLRLHPHVAANYAAEALSEYEGRVYNMSDYAGVTTLLAVADCLITDYSSIVFEYCLLDKKMIFYACDLQKFQGDGRGFYEEYSGFVPGPVVQSQQELERECHKKEPDRERLRKFREEMFAYRDGNAVNRLLELIFDIK